MSIFLLRFIIFPIGTLLQPKTTCLGGDFKDGGQKSGISRPVREGLDPCAEELPAARERTGVMLSWGHKVIKTACIFHKHYAQLPNYF